MTGHQSIIFYYGFMWSCNCVTGHQSMIFEQAFVCVLVECMCNLAPVYDLGAWIHVVVCDWSPVYGG